MEKAFELLVKQNESEEKFREWEQEHWKKEMELEKKQ